MNSSKAIRRVTIAIATLAAGVAWAHPGHGEPGATTTLLHLLTEPDHLLAILAVIGAGAWAVGRGHGRSARKQRRD